MRFVTLTLHPAIDRIVDVDRWIPGGTFDGRLRATVPAGKGVNTARSLRRLLKPAQHVTAAVWLGQEDEPFFAARLRAEGIALAVSPRTCATRVASTYLEVGGRETHVKEAMPAPTPAEARALLRFAAALPPRHAAVAVCGSAPNGTPPKLLAQALAVLRKRAGVLIADTNGPLLETAGRAGLDGIKGNAAEIAAWLSLDRPFDPHRARHRSALRESLCSRARPKAVLVTLGAAGAVLGNQAGIWHAEPPRLPVGAASSAVGCGDAATAGWLWGLGDSCAPDECLRRAVACGSAKLLSADPGGLDSGTVRRLLKTIKSKNLE